MSDPKRARIENTSEESGAAESPQASDETRIRDDSFELRRECSSPNSVERRPGDQETDDARGYLHGILEQLLVVQVRQQMDTQIFPAAHRIAGLTDAMRAEVDRVEQQAMTEHEELMTEAMRVSKVTEDFQQQMAAVFMQLPQQ